MIETKGIYHIGIPVNDLERAIKFYTEVLGMKLTLLNRDDMASGHGRAELRSGDAMVVLFQRPRPLDRDAVREDGATHQAFIVDREDFDLAVENMNAWGVKVHEVPVVERSVGRGFYFFDSEGNLLQLYSPPK